MDPIPPRRLHPVSPLVDLVVILPRMWPLLILAVSASWRAVTIGGTIVLAVMVSRVVAWWRTTYAFDGEELTVARGLLNRSVRRVPAARIQQVEVVRKLRHQILGVSMVRVQLADTGSDTGDVELDVLSQRDADALRAGLERSRRGASRAAATDTSLSDVRLPPPPPPREILRLSAPLLAIGGVTGATLLFVPAGIGALLSLLDDAGLVDDASSFARQLSGNAGWLIGIGGVVVSVVVAAAISVLRNHGFVLCRSGDDLTVQRGLFERRISTVPLARVQVVHLHANVVRAGLGLASVTASTSGRVARDGNAASGSVPVARWADAVAVAEIAVGERPIPAADRPLVTAAKRRVVRKAVLRSLVLTAWLPFVLGRPWWGAVAAAVALNGALGWRNARSIRHGVGPEIIVVEGGVLAWSRAIVPVDRIQSWLTSQSPLQRRHELHDVVLQLSGSRAIRIHDASGAQKADLIEAVAEHKHRRVEH